METKVCATCGKEKSLDEFYKFTRKGKWAEKYESPTRFESRCKSCKKQSRKYNTTVEKAQREKGKGAWKNLPKGTTKTCSGINGECHHPNGPDLPADDTHFSNNGRGKYGLNARCKTCKGMENKLRKRKKED